MVSRVYFWTDDHGRKLKCSAPLYFDYAMSYVQDLLTDEDVFPTKAGKETSHLSTCSAEFFFFLLISLVFCRFGVPDRLHLPGAEGFSAFFPDSGSYLLGPLQRDAGAGPAPPPQHALHTPRPLLQAARPAGAGGHRASAGPDHSPGSIELRHDVRVFTFPSLLR